MAHRNYDFIMDKFMKIWKYLRASKLGFRDDDLGYSDSFCFIVVYSMHVNRVLLYFFNNF